MLVSAYSNVNQLYISTYPLPLEPPWHHHPLSLAASLFFTINFHLNVLTYFPYPLVFAIFWISVFFPRDLSFLNLKKKKTSFVLLAIHNFYERIFWVFFFFLVWKWIIFTFAFEDNFIGLIKDAVHPLSPPNTHFKDAIPLSLTFIFSWKCWLSVLLLFDVMSFFFAYFKDFILYIWSVVSFLGMIFSLLFILLGIFNLSWICEMMF